MSYLLRSDGCSIFFDRNLTKFDLRDILEISISDTEQKAMLIVT